MKVLFVGDVVGRPGRYILKKFIPQIKEEHKIDIIIANGENAAGGHGITYQVANELFDCGVHMVTLGNHAWDKKEIMDFIDTEERIIRPENYPACTPGRGYKIISKNYLEIAIINLQGRVFMQPLECPFRTMDRIIEKISGRTNIIIVDFHAEATSEKAALGYYLDGRVSAVVGTHTHIQTADEKVLPKGTAYITDVGMTGPSESILGVKIENIITRFLTQLPNRFDVATGRSQLNAVVIDINNQTGSAVNIMRLQRYCE
ncbi:MAG: TIGR00282 family metallophosphoesterase [Bacillota bacterium]